MEAVPLAPDSGYMPDAVEFVRDRVPEFPGNNGELKSKYLTYRLFDFGVYDAAKLCGLRTATIRGWRQLDREFRVWEAERLPEVRKTLQAEIASSQFYRNMWLAMGLDAKILDQANKGLGTLSKQEHEYLLRMRGRYGPEALMAMLRIVKGDLGVDQPGLRVQTIFVQGPQGQVAASTVVSYDNGQHDSEE